MWDALRTFDSKGIPVHGLRTPGCISSIVIIIVIVILTMFSCYAQSVSNRMAAAGVMGPLGLSNVGAGATTGKLLLRPRSLYQKPFQYMYMKAFGEDVDGGYVV